jgi:aspartate kinase
MVLKIGGSIFTGRDAYQTAAKFVRSRLDGVDDRYVVVVSAERGMTDAMERAARRIVPTPARRAQDLLWATGELRSVAILTMHLQGLSVAAVGLNVHETGLRVPEAGGSCGEITFDSRAIGKAFDHHRVVIVPGFLATDVAGSIVSLGRGGSDLAAVLLAVHLRAVRCELVKGVGGYFSRDPLVDKCAEHIRSLSYEQALAMADDGCELVQREAIQVACDSNLPIQIRGMGKAHLRSVISSTPSDEEPTAAAAREPTFRD